jgi:hypothetical protein
MWGRSPPIDTSPHNSICKAILVLNTKSASQLVTHFEKSTWEFEKMQYKRLGRCKEQIYKNHTKKPLWHTIQKLRRVNWMYLHLNNSAPEMCEESEFSACLKNGVSMKVCKCFHTTPSTGIFHLCLMHTGQVLHHFTKTFKCILQIIFFIYYGTYNVSLECFMHVQNMLWGLPTNINTININKHNINII